MGMTPARSHRRWTGIMPLFGFVVVVAEIAFLCYLDMANKAAWVQYWTDSFGFPSLNEYSSRSELLVIQEAVEDSRCWEWLEKEDNVSHARDFSKDPVLVAGADQVCGKDLIWKQEKTWILLRECFSAINYNDWSSCTVGCKFGFSGNKVPDATFGQSMNPAIVSVHRSMESSQYYMENNIDFARRRGFGIIMTTSLSSDVPVGYFSWAEYDIMAPMQPKTGNGLAAAFISNCGAHNFRLQVLEMLEKLNITVDSYGSCHRNHDGNVDKVDTLKHYKFSLAFENSNEEDYVTEKFFQSLVAGTVPVVVGAPNIQDFAPSPASVLHIRELDDVNAIANTMKYLVANPAAYSKMLSWKFEGPSDSFKALLDMAAVHSSCRLCIHVATKIHNEEENLAPFQKRPCKCHGKMGTWYHLYVRERGRFHMESVFLSSRDLSLQALKSAVVRKFKSLNHIPIWKSERPQSLKGGDELKVYRIYPVGLTQRQALYGFMFDGDAALRRHIETHPCSKFEVIFV
ncbi:hypothetical protein HPP92_001948 [Vanilla planifolia]|uniref:Fucosyltransferase n=1 Tax=Vanilla planifolia TaxID=51239 RepID=A0A835S0U6_VANPL|nr:hypothetical protein HPP92_001948 [Vanilla planifolia]